MTTGPGRRPAPIALLGTVLGAVLVLTACGDVLPSQPPTPTLEPLPTAATTSYAIGVRATYAGLILHVDSAKAVVVSSGGSVAVDLRIDNPGTDTATLDAPILLAAGTSSVEPVRETVLPDVPAGGSSEVTVTFAIGAGFDLATAALRVGRTTEHQVIVPLVAGSQDPVTLDPVPLKIAGTGQAGSLRIKVTAGGLRSDLPDWGLEMPLATLALSVTYDATNRSGFAGGFAFTGANIGLRLPDGKIISARDDGHSQSAVVIDAGATVSGLVSRFEVPIPGTGSYALVMRDGSASKAIPFTIAPPVPASPSPGP